MVVPITNKVITNEVGGIADLAFLKTTKVLSLVPAVEAERELAMVA